jgi:hypothetical protein
MWNPDEEGHPERESHSVGSLQWSPDEELLVAVFETLDIGVAALSASETTAPVDAVSVLEALGTAVALTCGDDARQRVPETLYARLRDALANLSLSDLDEATDVLVSLAPRCLTLDTSEFAEQLLPLLQALRTRDRTELLWIGAELLGLGGAISTDARRVKRVFDETAESELWQLVPIGALRTTEMYWMKPAMRKRFWWRSRGAAIDANALYDVRRFAEVEDVFPEARPHLDAVRRTYPQAGAARSSAPATTSKQSAFLDRLFGESQPPIAPVISIRDWIARKEAARRSTVEGSLRVAAAGGAHGADALVLADDAYLELSLRGDTLILDVLCDLAPGSVPVLKFGARERFCEVVPKSEQRFTTTLAPEDFDATAFVVVLRLADAGVKEIPFDAFGSDLG